LTRSELVAVLAASNPALRQRDAGQIVLVVFDRIAEALARGGRVELRGFVSFSTKQRNARTARNPRNGEAVPLVTKSVPYFRTSRELLGRLNGGAQSGQRSSRLSAGAAKK
jgi:integration host factor subunit beta